jgi:hypothetical protein
MTATSGPRADVIAAKYGRLADQIGGPDAALASTARALAADARDDATLAADMRLLIAADHQWQQRRDLALQQLVADLADAQTGQETDQR